MDRVLVVQAPAELTEAFRGQGRKLTPQRQLLFRLLHGNETHPTAESLFSVASEQMPGISLRTVYQTLNDLVAMGELAALSLPGGPTRFDANVADHHHAHCTLCGELRDVYVDRLDGVAVHGLEGFHPTTASIVFTGLCSACAERSAEISNPTPKEQLP